MPKIAIGSNDGISVNEHFGRAGQFLIYEANEEGEFRLLETRKIDSNETDNQGNKINVLVELLADVKVVMVSQIGIEAVQLLQAKGMIAAKLKGPIDKALKAYAKRGKLLEYPVKEAIGCIQTDSPKRTACPVREAKVLRNILNIN